MITEWHCAVPCWDPLRFSLPVPSDTDVPSAPNSGEPLKAVAYVINYSLHYLFSGA